MHTKPKKKKQNKKNTQSVKALARFEQWYFDAKPRIKPEYIRMLFLGDENHQGLVHACGFSYNKVAWRASISLLVLLACFCLFFFVLDTNISHIKK